jgi:hypothetical protein
VRRPRRCRRHPRSIRPAPYHGGGIQDHNGWGDMAMRSRCAVLVVGVLIAHGALTGATLAQAESVTQPLPRFAVAPFPAHAVFAVVSSSSRSTLPVHRRDAVGLLGSVRLFLGDPGTGRPGGRGRDLGRRLRPLRPTSTRAARHARASAPGETQAVRSIGAWNMLSGDRLRALERPPATCRSDATPPAGQARRVGAGGHRRQRRRARRLDDGHHHGGGPHHAAADAATGGGGG